MNNVIEVHMTFSRNGIFLSGGDTSGRMDINGRTKCRTRMVAQVLQEKPREGEE
jgi:hypothetical protein